MKKIAFLALLIVPAVIMAQQQPTAKELYEKGRQYMLQGDYDNAELLFKKSLELDPKPIDVSNDLCYVYYLKRDFTNGLELGKNLIERPDASVMSFLILGLHHKAIAEVKECRKLYEKALKKFPKSGLIYCDYGQLAFESKEDDEAIRLWEKGIEISNNT
jgi:tetratricopeptide (TPR) repeat protein